MCAEFHVFWPCSALVEWSSVSLAAGLSETRGSSNSTMMQAIHQSVPRRFDPVTAAARAGLADSPRKRPAPRPNLSRRNSWRVVNKRPRAVSPRRGPTRPGVTGMPPPPPASAPPANVLAARTRSVSPIALEARPEHRPDSPPFVRSARLIDMMPAAAPPRIPTRVVRSKPSSRARNGGHKRAARYARVPPPVVYTPGRVQTAMRHMRSTSPLCMNHGGVNDRDMEPGPSFSTSVELSAVLNVSNSRFVESPTPSVVDELPSSRNALDAASTSFSEGQDMSPGTAKYLTFLNAKVRKSRKTYKTAEREAAAYVWVVPACKQQQSHVRCCALPERWIPR